MPAGRGWLYLAVDNIEIPRPWRVGRCTIAPARSVAAQLASSPPARSKFQLAVLTQFDASVGDGATIRIPVSIDADGRTSDAQEEAAGNEARDVLAVLRLLQEVRVPYFDASYQRFGLRPDVGHKVEPRIVTDAPPTTSWV